jgi:hypothetical protein
MGLAGDLGSLRRRRGSPVAPPSGRPGALAEPRNPLRNRALLPLTGEGRSVYCACLRNRRASRRVASHRMLVARTCRDACNTWRRGRGAVNG